jgi:hypothetical protein
MSFHSGFSSTVAVWFSDSQTESHADVLGGQSSYGPVQAMGPLPAPVFPCAGVSGREDIDGFLA